MSIMTISFDEIYEQFMWRLFLIMRKLCVKLLFINNCAVVLTIFALSVDMLFALHVILIVHIPFATIGAHMHHCIT